MALRKYRRRVAGVEQAPLSEASDAKPADDSPQGPEHRPIDAPAPPAQEQVTVTPQAPPSDSAAMSLKDQLKVMQQRAARADGEHIAAQASTPLEQQLEQIPGLSVMQRAYLRERPFLVGPLLQQDPRILTAVYAANNYSAQNQIPVDSPQYFQVMDHAIASMANIAFTTPPTAQPQAASAETAPPEPEMPKSMPQPSPSDDMPAHIYAAP